MRKQTKLVAVLSAAALLAIGASMTSFAATGWQKEDDTWYYYEKDGGKAYDKWQKSGDYWFYLGSDGAMVTSTLLEDGNYYYFLNEDGAMVTNTWVQITAEEDYDESTDDTYWYYFQNSGRAYQAATDRTTSFKTINGKKYAFGEDGKMLYGWVTENSTMVDADDEDGWQDALYYCGNPDDGSMKTGWCLIDVIDNDKTTDEADQSYWFWFQASGKKLFAEEGKVKQKGINGKTYGFDNRGVMVSEWNKYATGDNVATEGNATPDNYKWFSAAEDGHLRKNTWFQAIPEEHMDSDAYNNEEAKWFYADSKGYVVRNQLKTIKGKKYLFNEHGIMQTGLKEVEMTGKEVTSISGFDYIEQVQNATGTVYCFGDDGAMKTGTQTVEIDGEKYVFGFDKTGADKGEGLGAGKNTIVDGKIYKNGLLLTADSDLRYQAKSAVVKDANGNEVVENYLVNAAGTIMKNKKNLRDAEDYYWCTNAKGVVLNDAQHEFKCGLKDEDGNVNYCDLHNPKNK